MIKKIDNLGRVVVPKGYRQMLGLKAGDPLDLEVEGDRIIISAHAEGCTFCGSSTGDSTYNGKHVCAECLTQLRAMPDA